MLSHEQRGGFQQSPQRPLAELLSCPASIEQALGAATERRNYASGDLLFSQYQLCDGLYLLLAGEFYRTAERREKRLNLGTIHAGDLVELAPVLGDGRHTYTLMAATDAIALLFPRQALAAAFEAYPPLRMHLLEELGREVSRAYGCVYLPRRTRMRHERTAS